MRRYSILLIVYLVTSLGVDNAVAEEQQWLEVDQQRIPVSLYKSRKPPMLGGVLVLVAGGNSGAWPHSLYALGRHLPDDGWTTLRVDLLAAEGPKQQMAGENLLQLIDAAVELLRKEDAQNIVLVAAGGIAFQTLNLATDKRIASLQGLVFLDAHETSMPAAASADFSGLNMPVLDLLTRSGSERSAALQRKLFARQHNMANYRQIHAPAAGPNWTQRRDPVVQRVRGWLRKSR